MASLKAKLLIFGVFLIAASLVSCQDDTDDTATEGVNADDEVPDTETAEGAELDNGVIVLTDENFDAVVDSRENLLVEFYAPWCGHCKKLAPEYEAAAARLKDNDPPVALGKLDATENKDTKGRYDINGFPTLKWFKNGKAHDYDGPREEDGIVKYMQERASPSWEEPPEAVIVLTQENFTEITQREELMLVEFYAPWCGHCKKLAPEYEKAAQQLKFAQPNPILLAKVDATEEPELAKEYGVSGYPRLKVFRKGKATEYKGERDERGIAQYMYKQIGEASKPYDLKALQKFFKKEDISIVGFFNSETDKEYELYQEAANELREEFEFGHSFDAAARDTYKVNAGTVVVFNAEKFYTKYEPKWHTLPLQESTDSAAVQKFIKDHDIPLVGHMTTENKDKRYGLADKRPLVMVFYTVDWSFDYRDATQLWRNKIAGIATEFRDLNFAIANEEDFADIFKLFGFEESGEEMNIGILDSKDAKYPMEDMEDFDSDEIKEFLTKFKKGKLTPLIKSQPIPKKQGAVKVIVGKNFDKMVNDPKKDVLIEFYAPWCGHCKQLEPKYKDLAKKLKKEKNLIIAKLDATANDYPEKYQVSGFPTIFFVAANNKDNPVKYDGAREAEDMEKFLNDKATVSLGKGATKDEL